MFRHRRPGKPHPRSRLRLLLEELESRTLLSASSLTPLVTTPQAVMAPDSQASDSIDPQQRASTGTTTGPYTPAQVQTAYGFNQINFASYTDPTKPLPGTGQTIAIVDAYNDATLPSDLTTFDSHFHLPGLSQVAYNGTPPTNTPYLQIVGVDSSSGAVVDPNTLASAAPSQWDVETSLDVEWAHAMAPGANIVVIESSAGNTIDDMKQAVQYAAGHASIVSMSWGQTESSTSPSDESAFDQLFKSAATSSTNGVTFVAASGDSGALGAPIYPAVSPYVVSVGGTHLVLNSSTSTINNETGWGNGYFWSYLFGGSGGGHSANETEPAYQKGYATSPEAKALGNTILSNTSRSNPDVAYDADPNTGFYVYDTDEGGQWYEVGGTSAGAPQWAALIAIADQSRAINGAVPLSTSGTLSALYQAAGASSSSYTNDFRDITSGNNGYSARSGYDLVTGLGSPKAAGVVATLTNASAATPLASATATNTLTSHGTSEVKPKAVVASDGADPSSVSIASSTLPTTTTGAAVLIQPAQTLGTSSFAFDAAAVSTLGFGSFQTTATPSTNLVNQTQAAVPGFQNLALGLNSASNGSSARGNSLLTPFLSPSADGVMMIEPGRAGDLGPDGLPIPRQAIRVPGQGDGDLDLLPAIPAEERDEEAPACDACFMDEVSMAVVAEQTLALASGDTEASSAVRSSSLALLGIFASSLWMAPDRDEETRKRRRSLLGPSR